MRICFGIHGGILQIRYTCISCAPANSPGTNIRASCQMIRHTRVDVRNEGDEERSTFQDAHRLPNELKLHGGFSDYPVIRVQLNVPGVGEGGPEYPRKWTNQFSLSRITARNGRESATLTRGERRTFFRGPTRERRGDQVSLW